MTLIQALALAALVCALAAVWVLYAIERHRHAKARAALDAMTGRAQRTLDAHRVTLEKYGALLAEHNRFPARDEHGRFTKRPT